ncbi:hypothetical protein [Alicyclobacillus acidoterrestris]|uniref:Uncharacterized protein n=1 Tax=Alicyclobacillus acidoterrestris (strain ATCC 49025 / DSM 3922 / CIP 106132 / NCIMB 13137 / GD3B) TaxID=1356854 RepID=T0C3U9_ALIAG|nr:hypothetical protein [Alicyclobacillus acidoterrestris]EPZ47674.1 hypothetical protein N007_05310 [Alicyclobacillus acidoterrestris ATCC 49025]UNO48008.1 hypothetical protein K1I37_15140 [Alicyclobacillus acidoterrestris]
MQLITPNQSLNRTLRAGDVIVWFTGEPIMCISTKRGTKGLLFLRDGTLRSEWDSFDEIVKLWSEYDYEYTIYSADEWALQLVRLDGDVDGGEQTSTTACCKCGEKTIVHNGVCIDCALIRKSHKL